MADVLYHYRLWCVTESAWKYVWAEEGAPVPDKCPTNTAHTIDTSKTTIVESAGTAQRYTTDGEAKIVQNPNVGDEAYNFIPNFCDRCTWWQDASYQYQFAMTDSGDGLVWNTGSTPAHTYWIDASHGRIMHERIVDYEFQQLGYPSLIPVVEVYETDQWVQKTEDSQDPYFLADPLNAGDFYIDYASGEIHFRSSQAGKQVRASFYKSQDILTFTIMPPEGYVQTIEFARIIASSDFIITSPIVYELWTGETFLGAYVYENLFQLNQDAGGQEPAFPAAGGSVPVGQYKIRGDANGTLSFPMNYLRAREMHGDLADRLIVKLYIPWQGTYAIGVMYGGQKVEVVA